jgi:hypothetical protein
VGVFPSLLKSNLVLVRETASEGGLVGLSRLKTSKSA